MLTSTLRVLTKYSKGLNRQRTMVDHAALLVYVAARRDKAESMLEVLVALNDKGTIINPTSP